MRIRRPRGAVMALCLIAGLTLIGVAPAQAAGQPWMGRYSMVTYASQKGGTSAAVRQREADFAAVFTLSTSCGAGACVATADGPPSSNPTVPNPLRYSWDGQQWKTSYEWVWQCSIGGDTSQSQWSPAQSFTFYAPQPDGSLRGIWHTDISTGACRGSVVMPVAAYPA
ncbi:Rv2253 family sensor-like surface protein [Mycolicibacterium confluentis]|uniref:Uncharacterized protein n=1 Tax=Mycolicibacterium confluentis TaxID=28047 RepID=A0A7I7XSP4_9MYCO|nr:hypothetical protein [Mycolicibacterium confluentis]MCV7321247.1 hypothetical protein [Mycolicibacterium confluentis]ORV25272.1 hypothetical protein AWB99_22590 [Mycolicibacterium confluentis]BBZ32276.1 hypothetical protein MCNF_08810 [Mycolicibacterium confluentis]